MASLLPWEHLVPKPDKTINFTQSWVIVRLEEHQPTISETVSEEDAFENMIIVVYFTQLVLKTWITNRPFPHSKKEWHRIEVRVDQTWTEQMYENAHPNLALLLMFERTEVQYRTGLVFFVT